MSALEWFSCTIAGFGVLLAVYTTLLSRALRSEQLIGEAIVEMRAERQEPPQRGLLRAIADTLAGQEQEVAKIRADISGLRVSDEEVPDPAKLVANLLSQREPQALLTEFLRDHAGYRDSDAAFVAMAADIVRDATARVFGESAAAERLMALAAEGRIEDVARASMESHARTDGPSLEPPKVADLDPAAMTAIVRELDRSTRRQLRLATLLHNQAEVMMRMQRGKRGLSALWFKVRALISFPLPRRPAFELDDLDALALECDAIGEVLQMARERLMNGELTQAAHMVAGVRVPVGRGIPGRLFLQESLGQARPLAQFGVWHRLAVCQWVVAALAQVTRDRSL